MAGKPGCGGKKGRSGRKKALSTLVAEAMENVDKNLPELFEVLIRKAKDGDKECLFYCIDRRLGRPVAQIAQELHANLSLSAEDLHAITSSIAIEEQQLMTSAHELPPGSVTIQDIPPQPAE